MVLNISEIDFLENFATINYYVSDNDTNMDNAVDNFNHLH